ncbi:hypothetical protein LIER_33412 [Lithospermum erythrorhizon]|uniref:Uncharacterized protein n=1 Tax=Lithospermum erythrorhizon TaxID=34254 RepID=A0AAV3S0E1_LITER
MLCSKGEAGPSDLSGSQFTGKKELAIFTRPSLPLEVKSAIKAAVPIASFRSEQPQNFLLNGGAEGAKSTTKARSLIDQWCAMRCFARRIIRGEDPNMIYSVKSD